MTFTQPSQDFKASLRPLRPDLPTMYDLPSEFPEEPGLPDIYHDLQPEFLSDTLRLQNYPPNEYFTGSDLNVYYDENNPLWHKRPDWFLAVGVSSLYQGRDMRLSYVTWQEAANPLVIVELISPGTEDEDFGRTVAKPESPPTKWTVYEQILQVPYYLVFNRYTNQLRIFQLASSRYQEQVLQNNRFWIPELNLGLGLWYGTYKAGTHQESERLWLRWYNPDSQWSLTNTELANQRADAAQQRADTAEAKLEALKKRLRNQGLDPENFL